MAKKKRKDIVSVPIEWRFPDGLTTRFANNILIQSDATEFYISFFEILPPAISQDDFEKLTAIPADCVARIAIPRDRMPAFIRAMQEHSEKANSVKDGQSDGDG